MRANWQDMFESPARELGRVGQDKVADHNREWLSWIREHARTQSVINGSVTTDFLHEICEVNDCHPDHHNAWGSVFRGDWKIVGYRNSTRPKSKGRIIREWKWLG